MKSKDPAFLLYSSDFLIDCAELTNEEIGQYIRILCYIHRKGHLTEETICRIVGSILLNVRLKLTLDNEGKLYSEWLDEIIKARQKFVQSKSKNASKCEKKEEISHSGDNSIKINEASAKASDEANGIANNEASALARVKHMENEIYIENLNENKNEFFKEGGMGGTKEKSPPCSSEQEQNAQGISSSGSPPLDEAEEIYTSSSCRDEEAKAFWDYNEVQGWIAARGKGSRNRGQPVKNRRARNLSFEKNMKHFMSEKNAQCCLHKHTDMDLPGIFYYGRIRHREPTANGLAAT